MKFMCSYKFGLCCRKPVFVVGADRCTWKFAEFQKSLHERGVVRPFTGKEDVCSQLSHNDRVLCCCFTWWKKQTYHSKKIVFFLCILQTYPYFLTFSVHKTKLHTHIISNEFQNHVSFLLVEGAIRAAAQTIVNHTTPVLSKVDINFNDLSSYRYPRPGATLHWMTLQRLRVGWLRQFPSVDGSHMLDGFSSLRHEHNEVHTVACRVHTCSMFELLV